MYTYKKVKDLTLSVNDRYILSIDNHQEVMEALADFCRKKSITAGYITGLGAVSEATFRFLDPNTLKLSARASHLQTAGLYLRGRSSPVGPHQRSLRTAGGRLFPHHR